MRLSIRTILILSVTSLITILVSIIIASTYWRSEAMLNRLLRNIMVNISEYTIDKTELFLTPANEAADLVRKLASTSELISSNEVSMINLFYNQLTIYPQFAGILFGRANGELVYINKTNSQGIVSANAMNSYMVMLLPLSIDCGAATLEIGRAHV